MPKEIAYVCGWVLALAAVAVITVAVYPAVPQSTSTSTVLSWVELVAGVLLGAWLLVRSRRPRNAPAAEPKWMSKLDEISLPFAFVLGGFLPNYVLVVAAMDELMGANLSTAGMVGWGTVFVLVASIGVAAPLGVLVFRREQAPAVYERWRTWLVAHSAIAGVVILAALAVILVVKGVVGLVA